MMCLSSFEDLVGGSITSDEYFNELDTQMDIFGQGFEEIEKAVNSYDLEEVNFEDAGDGWMVVDKVIPDEEASQDLYLTRIESYNSTF